MYPYARLVTNRNHGFLQFFRNSTRRYPNSTFNDTTELDTPVENSFEWTAQTITDVLSFYLRVCIRGYRDCRYDMLHEAARHAFHIIRRYLQNYNAANPMFVND